MALCLLFLNIPELPGCSLYLFPKLIKSEIVWLFFRNTLLSLLFFSIFHPRKHPSLMPLFGQNMFKKRFIFFTLVSSFLLKTKKMRAFELFSSIAMVLWKRFLPFFHKSKLPALIPFLVKISWKYDLSILFIAAHYSLLKTEKKPDIFVFFSKILCCNCFFYIFHKT